MAVSVNPSAVEAPAPLQSWGALCPEGGSPRLVAEYPGETVTLADHPSVAVLFDGVLHDRAALVARLDARMESDDAELVAQGWSRLGLSLFEVLSGFFALAILDRRSGELICARDPLGVHPLFYARAPDGLFLSPSANTLAAQPGVGSGLNRAALADTLCRRWPAPQETFFEAVRRVPSGHLLRVKGRHIDCHRYWDPAPPGTAVRWADEEELENFDALLDQAVDRCLALGPTAIYLSGGLDSISVAAVATDRARNRGLNDPLALSLHFPEPQSNEEKVQRGVARELGLKQLTLPIEDAGGSRGLLESVLEISAARSAPVIGCWLPGYRALGLEARAAGCRSILTGGGGDEWLTVSFFIAADLIRSFDVRGMRRLARTLGRSVQSTRVSLWRNLLWSFGAQPMLRAAVVRRVPPDSRSLARWRRRAARKAMPDWVAPDPEVLEQVLSRAEQGRDRLEWDRSGSFYLQQGRISLDHAIVSMEMEEVFENGRSMDMRVLMPYWDPDLVDLLYRVPPDLLDRGDRAKALVRETLANRFSGLGLDRQKKVIASRYFTSVMLGQGSRIWDRIGGAQGLALAELGLVDPVRLDEFAGRAFSSNNVRLANRIWNVLNFESWVRPRI
jgi:Asparagine synthase/Glutamine amidotransferase domain